LGLFATVRKNFAMHGAAEAAQARRDIGLASHIAIQLDIR